MVRTKVKKKDKIHLIFRLLLNLKTLNKRLKTILTELDLSISELDYHNEYEIKNWISSKISTDHELNVMYSNSKILEHLKDLNHIFATGKNIVDFILLEITKELSIDITTPSDSASGNSI